MRDRHITDRCYPGLSLETVLGPLPGFIELQAARLEELEALHRSDTNLNGHGGRLGRGARLCALTRI
jgi:hypothetical protein